MMLSLRCLLVCCRLANERDDYKQIAHEYDVAMQKLKAENTRLKADGDTLTWLVREAGLDMDGTP